MNIDIKEIMELYLNLSDELKENYFSRLIYCLEDTCRSSEAPGAYPLGAAAT